VVGWDGGRLAMVLAVLDARCGLSFAGMDVYLNVAGGLRISEPAADLAVAAALVSARAGVALSPESVIFGEISLSGAVRPVPQTENRLKEASKLGFTAAVLAPLPKKAGTAGVTVQEVHDLAAFTGNIAGSVGVSPGEGSGEGPGG
jgi:DNA repair protein RadA/Sms